MNCIDTYRIIQIPNINRSMCPSKTRHMAPNKGLKEVPTDHTMARTSPSILWQGKICLEG